MENLIINAITEIANSNRLKESIEPNIIYHQKISPATTIRVLKSYLMFIEEYEKNENNKRILTRDA